MRLLQFFCLVTAHVEKGKISALDGDEMQVKDDSSGLGCPEPMPRGIFKTCLWAPGCRGQHC